MVEPRDGVVQSEVHLGQVDVADGVVGQPLDEPAEVVGEIPDRAADERNGAVGPPGLDS